MVSDQPGALEALQGVPGHELIRKGLDDLATGEHGSVEALLVSIGAPRLRMIGLDVPAAVDDPEHALYEALRQQHGDAAHGRYNALIRRLVSFERAASRAPAR